MPDLQSELRKLETLSFDDAGETQQETTMPYVPTNNASRKTFNFVRDNPNTTRKDAVNALKAQGVRETSSASLLGQFVRQGMIKQDANRLLTVTQQQYTPLKTMRKKTEVAEVTSKKKEAPIMEANKQVVSTNSRSAREILALMSVLQARELYDELKKIFGG
jgi:hypothetical protein